jgi:cytochrome c-type biogenesis protein CcsB
MRTTCAIHLVAGLLVALAVTSSVVVAQHEHGQAQQPPAKNSLSPATRDAVAALIVQDFQGRMKPLDTLSREMVVKITKKIHFEEWESVDLYMSWISHPEYWFDYPLLAVRHPQVKELLGVDAATKHVSAFSLLDADGQYRLSEEIESALRTPDKNRSKYQRKLLSFDERFNLFYMTLQGRTLRIFPLPDDAKNTWLDIRRAREQFPAEAAERCEEAFLALLEGAQAEDDGRLQEGAAAVALLQAEYGGAVLPGDTALAAELLLNRLSPFSRVLLPYFLGFVVLMVAFAWSLARRGGAPYSWRHPLYTVGLILFMGAMLYHLLGFVLRWIASGRAPLSNGYESLVFISLMVAVAGVIFEIKDRRGASAGLASLLTFVVLGVSMMSTFDPAIGPLVPVLASYWLNIHVTVITGSYGFLGLAALLGGLILVLLCFKGMGRETVRTAVFKLDRMLFNVLVTGLILLSIGTFLGGVWANESWGRYWGWDPKETWSLVTILVYAAVLHFRWIPALNRPWVLATGGFLGIASVIMTYFGVNYFLAGLHSYAQGDAAKVPTWAFVAASLMLVLVVVSGWFDRYRTWGVTERESPAAVTESK